jgi:hypothetical protein
MKKILNIAALTLLLSASAVSAEDNTTGSNETSQGGLMELVCNLVDCWWQNGDDTPPPPSPSSHANATEDETTLD